jgi:hypothetical protein
MAQGEKWGLSRQCGSAVSLALPAAILLSLAFLTQAVAAPYEPNDTTPAAVGPLAFGQTWSAALENSGDRDYFFFYVTSADATPVELTARNLGGGGDPSDLDLSILDTTGTAIASQAFIRDGETRTVAASLQPQKYFVEVVPGEGFGDLYSLSAGGGTGAFGSYAQIAGRCERATKTVGSGRVRINRAKSKLQRATARLRRSRYATRTERRKARAAQRAARATVTARQDALTQARRSQEPWCSIGS